MQKQLNRKIYLLCKEDFTVVYQRSAYWLISGTPLEKEDEADDRTEILELRLIERVKFFNLKLKD